MSDPTKTPHPKTEYHWQFPLGADSVLEALHEKSGLTKACLKDALTKGAIWLKTPDKRKVSRIRRAKARLPASSELFFYYDPALLSLTPPEPSLISDHNDFSVWYKPKGLLSQGSKWADHTTLTRWIEMHYRFNNGQRTAIALHRLDKATDGLMLVAHNHKAAKQLTLAFEQKRIHKIYQAWVVGKFPDARQTYQSPIDDKPAISHAHLLEYDETLHRSHLQIEIETGRKHQIRRHLSNAGFPIIGDRLYGTLDKAHPEDLQLTAMELSLEYEGRSYQFRLPSSVVTSVKPTLSSL